MKRTLPMLISLLITLSYLAVFVTWSGSLALSGRLGAGWALGLGLWWLDATVFYHWYQDEIAPTTYHPRLMTRSLIFNLILVAMTVFMLASSGSVIGMGVVLALWTGVVPELWQLRYQPEQFRYRFLWQPRKGVTHQEILWLVWAATVWLASVLSIVMFSLV